MSARSRTQRLARALEQLAEMHGQVGVPHETLGVAVGADYPPGAWGWPEEIRRAWIIANPTVYATPGDPDELARAIEEAHANWKRSQEQ